MVVHTHRKKRRNIETPSGKYFGLSRTLHLTSPGSNMTGDRNVKGQKLRFFTPDCRRNKSQVNAMRQHQHVVDETERVVV